MDPLNLPAPKSPRKAEPAADDTVTIRVPRSALMVVEAPSRFMRPEQSPAGRKAVLAAIARGEIAKYKPGKIVLVERAEHDRWIERAKVSRSAPAPAAPSVDDLDAALGLAPARAAGGRR